MPLCEGAAMAKLGQQEGFSFLSLGIRMTEL